jgi:hypothetical protein
MKIIHGKKQPGKYRHIVQKEMVGKTIEAIGMGTAEGAWGPEPTIFLFFDDKTYHGFVLANDLG